MVAHSDDGASAYRLTLHGIDSSPIGRELGIPNGTTDLTLAFRAEFCDMKFGDANSPATVLSNPYWNPALEVSDLGEPSRLPRYVDRGGEAVWRQPSLMHGARIFGFGIDVPEECQQRYLNTYINEVADQSHSTYGSKRFRLSACTGIDKVMLMFVEYDRLTSGTDDDGRLGGMEYRECLVMQLAISDDPEFPELDWFIPFIYLDTDAPRLGGREIFGYPKQLGVIPPFERYSPEVDAARRLELKATVIHELSEEKALESRDHREYRGYARSAEDPEALSERTGHDFGFMAGSESDRSRLAIARPVSSHPQRRGSGWNRRGVRTGRRCPQRSGVRPYRKRFSQAVQGLREPD